MKENMHNLAQGSASFRDVIESDEWRSFRGELPLVLGRREDGRFLIRDLVRLSHLLLSGTTGTGKSVCLRTIVCGLAKHCPLEVMNLVLVDLKRLEFPYCRDFPQMLLPVVCESKKADFVFKWMNAEIERRQKTLFQAGARDLAEFNCAEPGAALARIAVVIDDLGDLISQLEPGAIDRFGAVMRMGPRVGVHVICATSYLSAPVQRVIGAADQIGRMAFRTVSVNESKGILGVAGAEQLFGCGTALFQDEDGLICRTAVVAVDDGDIQNLVQVLRAKKGESSCPRMFLDDDDEVDDLFLDEAIPLECEGRFARDDRGEEVRFEDLERAVHCLCSTHRASTSHFQRQFGWGYGHAEKILEALSDLGIVSTRQGLGPRTILKNQDEAQRLLEGARKEFL